MTLNYKPKRKIGEDRYYYGGSEIIADSCFNGVVYTPAERLEMYEILEELLRHRDYHTARRLEKELGLFREAGKFGVYNQQTGQFDIKRFKLYLITDVVSKLIAETRSKKNGNRAFGEELVHEFKDKGFRESHLERN